MKKNPVIRDFSRIVGTVQPYYSGSNSYKPYNSNTKKVNPRKNPVLLVVDGSSLLHRMYHRHKGEHPLRIVDKVANGFISMINSIREERGVTHLFVAWDVSSTITWRYFITNTNTDLLPMEKPLLYKASRPRNPIDYDYIHKSRDKLTSQFKEHNICQYISRLKRLGNEADDIVASIAHSSYKDFKKIFVYTADKDLVQLVNKRVSIINPQKGVINLNNAKEVMGVEPEQIVDYLSMVGDVADNIRGIKGCGHMSACTLLNKYVTLDTVIKNKSELTGRLKTIVDSIEPFALEFTRILVTLNTNVIRRSPKQLKITTKGLSLINNRS